jgi:predicted metal-dependent peptidase
MPRDAEAEKKLQAAAYMLGRSQRYLAPAIWKSERLERPGLPVPFAIDERFRIYYDPERVKQWTIAELAAVYEHELSHVLRKHFARGRMIDDVPAWKISTDLEINDDIPGLPEGTIHPNQYALPTERTAEEYYPEISRKRKEQEKQGGGQGESPDCGSGADGQRREWDAPTDGSPDPETGETIPQGIDEAEAELTRHQVAQAIRKDRGSVPGHWQRWAEEAEKAKVVDWRKELATALRTAHAQVAGNVDYSRRRPSRRQAANPYVILPGMVRPVPSVAGIVDTSGSMSGEELKIALDEIDGILDAIGHREPIPVLAVDASVHEVTRASNGRQVKLSGGGGTDMRVGIAAAAKLKPRPQVIVILTDMYTPWPADPPPGTKMIAVAIGHDDDSAANERVPDWLRVIPAPINR